MNTAHATASPTPAIVWFRQDLRLADHAALHAAMAQGRPILPLYILDDESPDKWPMGAASRWWLHHSLASLAKSLAACGAPLIFRRGATATVLPALLAETGATEIHAGRAHEPWARTLEAALEKTLPGTLQWHRTTTLFDQPAVPVDRQLLRPAAEW